MPFNRKTVFVLGAGASKHYGYPIGHGLVSGVKNVAKELAGDLERISSISLSSNLELHYLNQSEFLKELAIREKTSNTRAIEKFKDDLNKLSSRLDQINPLVIDYFLEENEDLREVGQLCIAMVILKCQAEDKHGNGENDWYRFILNNITRGLEKPSDLGELNNIKFITFNYDLSLEKYLYSRLKQIYLFHNNTNEIDAFFENLFIHVYGQLNINYKEELTGAQRNFLTRTSKKDANLQNLIDFSHESAKTIKTINNVNKDDNDTFKKAKFEIEKADSIYILGYGFDDNNNIRIGLDTLRQLNKRVYFTNHEDKMIINKRASFLFTKKIDKFHDRSILDNHDWQRPPYYEKSIRTVYEALEKDFDIQNG